METIVKRNNKDYTITLDDDPMVVKIIEKTTGLPTIHYSSAKKLAAEAKQYSPIAAFVDIYLGIADCGLDIVPALRAVWPYAPILIVTIDPTEEAVSAALAAGADDFLRKPLRPKELMARLQARLKDLAQKEAKSALNFADITLDTIHRTVRGRNGLKYLTSTESNLLLCLARAKGTIVPRSALKRHCWGDISVSDNALDRKMHEIRKALKDISETVTIRTAYGEGFVMELTDRARKGRSKVLLTSS
ncbi:MAG: response regulator transcription factor [Deltaproteobacteria bacterium]|nr:response regulator transcription factor [Deltaproteobacteria bacterium]